MYPNCYGFRDLRFIKTRENKMTTKFARVFIGLAFTLMSGMITLNAFAGDEEATGPSLYERLGAQDGLAKIASDTIALHHKNPEIAHYFADVDDDELAAHVVAFFAAGTGGPANYQGRDMVSTHATMKISAADFDSAVVDVLKAVEANGVDAESKAEVAAILESLRPAVMGTTES
jgi:truncated hemoglobin YjbI